MFNKLIEDTLKKEGKWSRTSLTMFSAWIIAVFLAVAHFVKMGFDFQVFITFVAVALGTKLTDSIGTRISTREKL